MASRLTPSEAALLECNAQMALGRLSSPALTLIIEEHLKLEGEIVKKISKMCAALGGADGHGPRQPCLSAVLTALSCARRVPHAQQRHRQGN